MPRQPGSTARVLRWADLSATDIPFIALMLSGVADNARLSRPEVWHRYLTLLIDGMCASRSGSTPLPAPALSAGELETTMRQHARRRS